MHKILTEAAAGSPEWLRCHSGKLGSTDVATFFKDPDTGKRIGRKSKLDLYVELTQPEKRPDLSALPQIRRGLALEPLVKEFFTIATGREVRPPIGLVQHPTLDCLAVTPDGHTLTASGEEAVFEAKTIHPMRKKEIAERGLPWDNRIQGQVIAWVLGVKYIAFAPYCLDQDSVEPVEEEADPAIHQMAGDFITDFMEKFVKKGIPPPVEEDDLATVKALYPTHYAGKVHVFDPAWELKIMRKYELAEQKGLIEKEQEALNAMLLAEMADAEYATCGVDPMGRPVHILRARTGIRKAYMVKEGTSRPLIKVSAVGG